MLAGADKPDRIGLLPGEAATRDPPTYSKGNYKINWLNSIIVLSPPVMVFAAWMNGVQLTLSTFIVGVIFYYLNGFGITVGYHRLFAHRSFVTTRFMEKVFGFLGAGALQGSIKWWSRNHRVHHNFIDTDRDPYNAKRGFLYSHIGWMLMKQDYGILGYVDISDLHANRYVEWQHDYYLSQALLSGVILPTVICGLISGDWMGGYFYAGLAKAVFVHHSTFFINSLAHSPLLGGTQSFSEEQTSRDSVICSLLALGEGMHNGHHSFPQNYANGVMWYDYDPSKWLIRTMEFLGLAKHIVRVPNAVLERSKAAVAHRVAERHMKEAEATIERLDSKTAAPVVWTWDQVMAKVRDEGRKLMVVGDYVIDIEKKIHTGVGYTHGDELVDWTKVHPGGYRLLDAFIGKDATDAMTGGVYKHTEGAMNLLLHMRVASLKKEE